jgi:hypothetical protein
MRDITQKLDGKRIALAVIDHVVSTTAIVAPVKRVIEMMRSVRTPPLPPLPRVCLCALGINLVLICPLPISPAWRRAHTGRWCTRARQHPARHTVNRSRLLCGKHSQVYAYIAPLLCRITRASCRFRDVCSCGLCDSARCIKRRFEADAPAHRQSQLRPGLDNP